LPVLVGTSGWQYRSWKGTFYPEKLRQADWLEHYAAGFATVEVNNAFYRLPESSTFASWASRTPDDFVVAVKASRYLTHIRRLRQPAEPVRRLLERITHLGPKLGPVLLQLPPNLTSDHQALEETLELFPSGVRVAVEFRHESWFTDRTRDVLSDRGVALCLADSPRRRTPVWRTADWGYLRMHEGRASPHPCYGRQALRTWAEKLAAEWPEPCDVYVYFNNDARACAVRDAITFARAAEREGLNPTRVPHRKRVRLGE
jgi:uncharacterized protein YecE (DUF72 family)